MAGNEETPEDVPPTTEAETEAENVEASEQSSSPEEEEATTTPDEPPPEAESSTATTSADEPPAETESEQKEIEEKAVEQEKSHTMEEELLFEMLRDRDIQIGMIERKMEEQKVKLERVKIDLREVRQRREEEKTEQEMEVGEYSQKHSDVNQKYKDMKDNLDMKKQQQGANLQLYHETIKSVASPESRDSSYVMRMQAQLCKAMHSMGMTETQLSLAAAETERISKYLKEKVTTTFEDKSNVELTLMNKLLHVDAGKIEVEEKHKTMMTAFTKEKDTLTEKIEAQQEEPEEEPSENEEEEIQELKEILSQGQEEVDRLEKENSENLDKLEELKQQVSAVKGEQFVDELVTAISEELKIHEEEDDSSEDEDSD